jgi:hypothetical protein
MTAMSTAHQLHQPSVSTAMAVSQAARFLRPFAVTIRIGHKPKAMTVVAFTSCDAIVQAIEAHFDGEESLPDGGMEVSAVPLENGRQAA